MTIKKDIGIDSKTGRPYVELKDMEAGVSSNQVMESKQYFDSYPEAKKFYDGVKVYTEAQVIARTKQYRTLK